MDLECHTARAEDVEEVSNVSCDERLGAFSAIFTFTVCGDLRHPTSEVVSVGSRDLQSDSLVEVCRHASEVSGVVVVDG